MYQTRGLIMSNRAQIQKIIKETKNQNELSPFAYSNPNPTRKKAEKRIYSLRSEFAIDRDRILYSGAYRRYQGKTQVFAFSNQIDEEMTNRSLHTTYVSQVSRTIGKVLGLNIDLIEAIALGHDLGHTPLGHAGGRALSTICKESGIGGFFHNIQSLQIVDNISIAGDGLNLSFPTRDGIIFHDGQTKQKDIIPQKQRSEKNIQSYIKQMKEGENTVDYFPATLEGCVVRQADTIAYLGQDLEDALRFGVLKKEDIPKDIKKFFGITNSQIINKLVESIICSSYQKNQISLDDESFFYMKKLRVFNYKNIYTKKRDNREKLERAMRIIFEKYLLDLEKKRYNSKIFKHFINSKSTNYLQKFNNAEKVRDFISTMTDRYFNQELKEYIVFNY